MTDALQRVTRAVQELLRQRRQPHVELSPGLSLVEDLGFDSLAFVDLTLILEAELGVDEFPLQNWIDKESMTLGKKHTIASLARHAELRLAASEPLR
jgi:acyl carrier protein